MTYCQLLLNNEYPVPMNSLCRVYKSSVNVNASARSFRLTFHVNRCAIPSWMALDKATMAEPG
jgi:hypothetical protein